MRPIRSLPFGLSRGGGASIFGLGFWIQTSDLTSLSRSFRTCRFTSSGVPSRNSLAKTRETALGRDHHPAPIVGEARTPFTPRTSWSRSTWFCSTSQSCRVQ
jgi:hypothetical protein